MIMIVSIVSTFFLAQCDVKKIYIFTFLPSSLDNNSPDIYSAIVPLRPNKTSPNLDIPSLLKESTVLQCFKGAFALWCEANILLLRQEMQL